jgi:hypothetical protein
VNLKRRVKELELRAAAEANAPALPPLPLRNPADVVELLSEQANVVRCDVHADPLDRAKTLAVMGGLALRAMEAAGARARLEALERAMKVRAQQAREQAKRKR